AGNRRQSRQERRPALPRSRDGHSRNQKVRFRPSPRTHGCKSVGSFSRRQFLATSGALFGAGILQADNPHLTPPPRPKPATRKLAVVTTAYHYLSHAYHVCGRFLNGYLRDGKHHYPDFAIAGMYVEQQKANDLSRELSRKHGYLLADNVANALTLGKDKLAVDGVLLI